MYTTGRYKYRYKTTGGYDTTAVRKNGDVNSIRVESGLYGKSTKVNGKEKPIFIIQKEDFPELWSGINCFMKTANGIPTYLFNHL